LSEQADFEEVWETLIRTGVRQRWSQRDTITPGAYATPGSDAGEAEVSLPPPLLSETQEIAALPQLSVAHPQEHTGADLEVREELGKGGMGQVLLATQHSLGREVAIKRLLKSDRSHIAALLREARIVGGLEHPNIVPVHALGRDDDGRPLLVMKRIEGKRWSQILRSKDDPTRLGSAVLDRNLSILKDVCNAVHYAHSKGVVHRDIKPDNVLIGEFGEVVLVDWGVAARLDEPHEEGLALGTPAWMSPEMVQGEAPSIASDVYLLGASLHAVLTGMARHKAANIHGVMLSAYRSSPYDYPPEVPQELAEIANRACHRDPDRRHESAMAFRRALEAWEAHRSSHQLATAAQARLEHLRRELQVSTPDLRRVIDTAASARFGLRQALEAWPDNPAAIAALQETLGVLIPWEIKAGEAEAARAALDELLELVPESDHARYAALEEQVDHEVRRVRALAKLGQELDWSVQSGWRAAFLMVYTGSALFLGAVVIAAVRLGFIPLDLRLGFFTTIAVSLWMIMMLSAGRKRLLANVAGQRIMFAVLVTSCVMCLHRGVAWAIDAPFHATTLTDLMILATASGIGAVGISLRLFWVMAMLVVITVAAAAWPGWAFELAVSSLGLAGLLMTILFWPSGSVRKG